VAICSSIIEDDKLDAQESHDSTERDSPHPLFAHPLASSLMAAIEMWIREESLGKDGSLAPNEMRGIASQMIRSNQHRNG